MKVSKVIPSGYCKGVVRAIDLAKKTRLNNPDEKIYILGMIVHNSYITKALSMLDIITLNDKERTKEELLDEIDEGIVIFTAHGISDKIKEKAISKGLKTVDASCTDVLKTKDIVIDYLNQNYEILYIGKNKHPEAEAILAISDKIHLVTNVNDIKKDINSKVFVTNQTTMSTLEIEEIINEIKNYYPDAVIQKEICNATSSRQNAILILDDCDLLYIVGDPKSNNSNKLKEIAKLKGIKKVKMIETVLELKEDDFEDVENIYVTAGASTPTYLTNTVIETIQNYIETKVLNIPEIDINKII